MWHYYFIHGTVALDKKTGVQFSGVRKVSSELNPAQAFQLIAGEIAHEWHVQIGLLNIDQFAWIPYEET